jgi:ribosomal protein S18 acetylase RimI-like enzyme
MCTIRNYKSNDKKYLRKICEYTATPTNHKNLASVSIMYNDYYTENEPNNILVLCNEKSIPVGYILCSTNYNKWLNAMNGKYKEKLAKVDPNEIFTLENVIIKNHESIKEKSNHFHIDILPDYQRKGYGHKLIEELCEKLKNEGINHISAVRIKKNSGSYNLCLKEGFYILKDYGDDTFSLTKDLN